MVYYNDNDAKVCAWLRELIKAGVIADGVVDERPIQEVEPSDLTEFAQCHFFAGIGGWSYALALAGWPDDRTVWTGSCPCQPFSAAGKGGGFNDERHLWPDFYRLIVQSRPPVVFGEQVASPAGLAWLDAVSADLEDADYAIGAADLCAAGVGAPHIRQRLYWVADNTTTRLEGRTWEVGDSDGELRRFVAARRSTDGFWRSAVDWIPCRDGKRRPVESGICPLAHGISARVGRLRGYGNAIVPQVAQAFIEAYLDVRG